MTVDLLTQLERYGDVIDNAVLTCDVAAIKRGDALRTGRLQPQLPQPRWRTPAVAGAAFVGVLLLGVIIWAVGRSSGETGPADQPDPATTVEIPTGARAPVEVDPLLGVPFEPVIPFVATIKVTDEVIEGDDIVIEGPVFEVTHGGIVLDNDGNRRLVGIRITEPAGSFVVVTDQGAGTYLADRSLFVRWTEGPFDAGEFAWRWWSEYCSLGSIEVGSDDEVAGRAAARVTCTRASGAVELWVDTETGIVLRVQGSIAASPLIGQNLGVLANGFSVTVIDFDVEPINELFLPVAPSGSSTLEGGGQLRRLLARFELSVEEAIENVDGLRTHPLVGQPAPQLRGPTLDGDQFDLASQRGRTVVVLWWGSWCGPGTARLEVLNAASFVRDDIVFVAVTWSDDPDLARQIASDARITIPIVDTAAIDPDPSEAWQIELRGCPATLHVDGQGTVITMLGPYGTVDELLNQL